jgi:hypothetical protein
MSTITITPSVLHNGPSLVTKTSPEKCEQAEDQAITHLHHKKKTKKPAPDFSKPLSDENLVLSGDDSTGWEAE